LRVIGGRGPNDDDERRQSYADQPQRHVQPDVLRADERDLRREVGDPQRHHYTVRMHQFVGDRWDVEEGAEVVGLEVAREDDQREEDRGGQEQTPIRGTP
jgi:hypothetical protein